MDKTLERIISLLPTKPDGSLKHGARTEFAKSIGAPGNIFAEWMAGRNGSYKNYIYQIADKYNVSVEWLKGESDQKEKSSTPVGAELDAETIQLREIWDTADQEEREALLAMARMLKARRVK